VILRLWIFDLDYWTELPDCVCVVQAYSAWMKGLFDFELEVWRSAMDNFSKAK